MTQVLLDKETSTYYGYLFQSAWLFFTFSSLVFSDPGRLNDKDKQILNDKFLRLNDLIIQQKENPDELLRFQTTGEATIFKNYFFPKDLIYSHIHIPKQFQFCKHC